MATAHTASGQFCAIVGEPGVGKSRLAFETIASAFESDWRVLWASCSSHGRQLAYAPVVTLLRQLFGLPDMIESLAAVEEIKSALQTPPRNLKALVTPLLALLNLPTEETWEALEYPQRRALMHSAVTELISEMSRERPL